MKYITKLIGSGILFMGLTCLCGCKAQNYWKYAGYDGYSYRSVKANEITDFVAEVSQITNLNGIASLHYGDGQMYAEYHLTNNIIQGTIKLWNGKNQIIMHATYTNGLANGVYKTWHDNGVLASISSYSNGVSSWDGNSWYDSGTKRWTGVWIDEKLKILREKNWDRNGNLITDGVNSNLNSVNGSFIIKQIEGEPPIVGVFTNGMFVRKYYYKENTKKQ